MKKKKTPGKKRLKTGLSRQNVCLIFELLFLKCNENAVFLFKNTRNKEKGHFLFEKRYFCYLWSLLLFSYFIETLVDLNK